MLISGIEHFLLLYLFFYNDLLPSNFLLFSLHDALPIYGLLFWLLLIQASLPVIKKKNLFYSENYVLFRCYFHSLLQIKEFEKLPLPAPFVNDLAYERCREPIWLTHDQWPPLATACQHLALLEYVLSLASVQITR